MVKDVVKRLFSEFLGKMQSAKTPVFARGCGISDFARMPGVLHAPKAGALPTALHPGIELLCAGRRPGVQVVLYTRNAEKAIKSFDNSKN